MAIKENVHAFKIANKTYFMVKKFNKEFLDYMRDESLDTKLKMYSLCIEYMRKTLEKKFN